jgi:hypothetical protein
MILVYRPELENPPMAAECTIGFTFVNGGGLTDHIQVKSGVTRDFPEDVWARIQDFTVVKSLLSLGALRIDKEDTTVTEPAPKAAADSLADVALHNALKLIESSFDIEQLRRWDAGDSRIRIKNAIAHRVTAITEGNG